MKWVAQKSWGWRWQLPLLIRILLPVHWPPWLHWAEDIPPRIQRLNTLMTILRWLTHLFSQKMSKLTLQAWTLISPERKPAFKFKHFSCSTVVPSVRLNTKSKLCIISLKRTIISQYRIYSYLHDCIQTIVNYRWRYTHL